MDDLKISVLDRSRPIHLSGIAGSAMRGLALMLRQQGFEVVGTDPNLDNDTERLGERGIRVHRKQDGSRIPEGCQLLVASAALPGDHSELSAARRRGIRVATYPEFLGAIMSERNGVAVAGTHGKTTVTAMITWCLCAAGIRPGFVGGGFVPGLDSSADRGESDIFVAEACEYNRSFLNLHPQVAVITNIETDHLDVYKNLEAIEEAFFAFASHLPKENGTLVYNAECQSTATFIDRLECQKVGFALGGEALWTSRNLRSEGEETRFALIAKGREVCEVTLRIPGRHNVANALAAIAACNALDITPEKSARALADFTGVRRRFEIRGHAAGVTVVDDYAHHPTELRGLIAAARERFGERRIVLAFQPHQYSRTRLLMDDFAEALARADTVLVPNIYFARDNAEDQKRVSAEALVDKISARGTPAEHLGDLETLTSRLLTVLRPDDVLITAGAGDIDRVVDPVLKGLHKSSGARKPSEVTPPPGD